EIVHNGRVVARADADADAGVDVGELRLRERVRVTAGWIAARCWGPGIVWHEWPVRVAAHTSPVYLGGASMTPSPADALYLGNILDGGLAWLGTLATQADPVRHDRIRSVFLEARQALLALGQPSPPA